MLIIFLYQNWYGFFDFYNTCGHKNFRALKNFSFCSIETHIKQNVKFAPVDVKFTFRSFFSIQTLIESF